MSRSPRLAIAGNVALFAEAGTANRIDLASGTVTPLPKAWDDTGLAQEFLSDGKALFVNAQGAGAIHRIDRDLLTAAPVPIELPAGMHRVSTFSIADDAILLAVHRTTEPRCKDAGIYRVPTAGGVATRLASILDEGCANHAYRWATAHGDRIFMALPESGALRYELWLARAGSVGTAKKLLATNGYVREMTATAEGVLVCDDLRGTFVRDDGTTQPLEQGACHSPRWHNGRAYWIDDGAQRAHVASLP